MQDGERIMITRRPPRARSFERSSGRRASQMHGGKAAGMTAAAAEAAGAAGGSRRGRRAVTSARDDRAFAAGCRGTLVHVTFKENGYFGHFGTKIFFACGALQQGLAAAGDPPRLSIPVTSQRGVATRPPRGVASVESTLASAQYGGSCDLTELMNGFKICFITPF